MSSENKEKNSIIYAVCAFCLHSTKNANLEFNFKEQKIYYICTECKKQNTITAKPNPTPFPKTRLM